MRTLFTIGVIALILILVGLVPIGIDAARDNGISELSARVWFFAIRIGGERKAGKRSAGKDKSHKKEKPDKKTPPLPVLKILAKNGYTILCRIVSSLRVDVLKIHFTAANAGDPAAAAMEYSAAALAMDALYQIGEGRIGRPDLRADVDFEAQAPSIDFRIRLSIRLYRLLGAAARFGFGFLRDYIAYKREG